MTSAAARLARVEATAPVSQPPRLSAIFSETRDLRGSFRWFLTDRSNDLVASVYFWLNLLFLAATWRRRWLREICDAIARRSLKYSCKLAPSTPI